MGRDAPHHDAATEAETSVRLLVGARSSLGKIEDREPRQEAVLGDVHEAELETRDLLGDVDEAQLNRRAIGNIQSAQVHHGRAVGDVHEADVDGALPGIDPIDEGRIQARIPAGVDIDEADGCATGISPVTLPIPSTRAKPDRLEVSLSDSSPRSRPRTLWFLP